MRKRFFSLTCLLIIGCSVPVKKVHIDTGKITLQPTTGLECAYSLTSISDQRPVGDIAGTLGSSEFRIEDATGLIQQHLQSSGIKEDGERGTPISLALMRLYISERLYTRIPTVVYQVQINDDAPILIRSQLSEMSWSVNEQKAYEGYAKALQNANEKLVAALNNACPK